MAFFTKTIFDTLSKDFIGSESLANQINSFYEGRKPDITITNKDYKITVTELTEKVRPMISISVVLHR